MVRSVRKMSRNPARGPINTLAGALNRSALQHLTRDGALLFLTRFTRLFSYGALSVVLVFYLTGLGFSESQTGMLLTLTLLGDTVVSLFLTTQADRIGRRLMLITGAILITSAGVIFASTHNLLFLAVAGTIGVISPSGNEVGPFLSIEQALSQVIPARERAGGLGAIQAVERCHLEAQLRAFRRGGGGTRLARFRGCHARNGRLSGGHD